ncbi:LysR family transcriptional regulator [Brevundimonas sp. S30B]|jgi:DNA-binding transcriptional LysR family regulator|uniref:LysR substrate-binding domain-containing protein n=1 Tax=unclassified Brevundimonas TaxID=2622653 RepID=UPI001072161B|nr:MULTISPECIES: LysR substrate-binding domain-containing protein [unclassified Brevundimonas]QBX36763.1 LysR family transcriptional regulator [Brevundimonas sp. MF30-B]TFW04442.1 LysR family transcriptional regulator [Brevundimonas sp. S30B]
MHRLVNLDLDLLRAFVTVADTSSFTRAGVRLGRSQPAISLQIRRLENQVGVELFSRNARDVILTAEGQTLLPSANALLRLNDQIIAGLNEGDVEGEVRFGAPEDIATAFLPRILGDFARSHPRVSLAVTCDYTANLLDQLSKGALDLALIKREPMGPDLGVRVWREPLVWVAADPALAKTPIIPLITAPAPDIYRKRALAALTEQGVAFRIAYTSPSLAGQHAALRAGLGVGVLSATMTPKDLVTLSLDSGLPDLHETEIALVRARGSRSGAADLLSEQVLRSLDRDHIAL